MSESDRCRVRDEPTTGGPALTSATSHVALGCLLCFGTTRRCDCDAVSCFLGAAISLGGTEHLWPEYLFGSPT